MDDLTLIEILRFGRVVVHAVTATYLTYLIFHRQRDQWLYASLALQYAFVVIWAGTGVFVDGFEATYRPWQTIPVLITLIVIVNDFIRSRSPKAQALRRVERDITRRLEENGSPLAVHR